MNFAISNFGEVSHFVFFERYMCHCRRDKKPDREMIIVVFWRPKQHRHNKYKIGISFYFFSIFSKKITIQVQLLLLLYNCCRSSSIVRSTLLYIHTRSFQQVSYTRVRVCDGTSIKLSLFDDHSITLVTGNLCLGGCNLLAATDQLGQVLQGALAG